MELFSIRIQRTFQLVSTYKRTFHVNIYINTKNEIVQIREGSARFLF